MFLERASQFPRIDLPPLLHRVARWYISKQKSHFGYFLGACNGRGWYILWAFGLFYGHLVQFMDIWYMCWLFGIFSPVLVSNFEKNLATLLLHCAGMYVCLLFVLFTELSVYDNDNRRA
jgi:hypothetical protein